MIRENGAGQKIRVPENSGLGFHGVYIINKSATCAVRAVKCYETSF